MGRLVFYVFAVCAAGAAVGLALAIGPGVPAMGASLAGAGIAIAFGLLAAFTAAVSGRL